MELRSSLLAMVLLAGCYSSSENPDAGVTGRDSGVSERDAVEQWVREWRAESCRRGIECEAQGGDAWDEYYCHPANDFGASTADDATEGRVTFDREAAEACLATLREGRGCVPYAEECSPFENALERGAPCAPDEDRCRSGLHCDVTRCACVPSPGPGEPCANRYRCAAGSRCVFRLSGEGTCMVEPQPSSACEGAFDCAEETPYCAEGRCVSSFSVGDPCERSRECGPDLWCDTDASPATCERPRELGAECSGAGSCSEGLACVARTCAPLRRAGEDCSVDEDCVPDAPYCVGGPISGGVCRASPEGGACFTFGLRSAGESCGPDHSCVPLTPDDFEGRCRRNVGRGGACEVSPQCPLGDRCSGGLCVRIAGHDGDCGTEAVCPLTHRCRAGRCVPLGVEGEACASDDECFQSICSGGVCGDIPPGGSCGSGNATCQSRCDFDTLTCIPALLEGDACPFGRTFCDDGTVCNGDADARCAPLTCG